MVKFLHVGVPVDEKPKNAVHVPHMGLWRTNPAEHPFLYEFVYLSKGSPLPVILSKQQHVAYQVDSIEDHINGAKIISDLIVSASGSKIIRFIERDNVILELSQNNIKK